MLVPSSSATLSSRVGWGVRRPTPLPLLMTPRAAGRGEGRRVHGLTCPGQAFGGTLDSIIVVIIVVRCFMSSYHISSTSLFLR